MGSHQSMLLDAAVSIASTNSTTKLEGFLLLADHGPVQQVTSQQVSESGLGKINRCRAVQVIAHDCQPVLHEGRVLARGCAWIVNGVVVVIVVTRLWLWL